MNELNNLLKNKKIISILDGDTKFEDDKGTEISMPYLSGPTLCDISNMFGLTEEYSWSGGSLSRWKYMENLIEHCIENHKIQDLLSFLFSKRQFSNQLSGLTPEQIDEKHNYIVEKILEQVNSLLYFGGNELRIIDNNFIVKPVNAAIEIEVPKIKVIDREYIRSLAERAQKDIDEKNYDSAITKSRTLVEEVFCYVIEKKEKEPSNSGNINKLYKQVKSLYNMHPNKEHDKRINMLLSGLEKIITSIAQMRNKEGDSHGVGKKRINISDYHARMYVNAAMTISDFVLDVSCKSKS